MEREERVTFPNDQGQILKGVVHYPAGSTFSAAAILCHGMESNKESEKLVALGRALAQKGILALRFDFACAGESGGKFAEITYSGEVRDLKAAFTHMRHYPVRKIGIFGSSMGGTVALLFAAEEPQVANLVTIAAPFHPEKFTDKLLTREEVENWRRLGHLLYHGRRINISLLDDLQRLDVPGAAKRVSCPVLILHGDADETVPVEEAEELYAHLRGPKKIRILKGADHRFSDPSLLTTAMEESLAWMTQYLQ